MTKMTQHEILREMFAGDDEYTLAEVAERTLAKRMNARCV